MRECSTPTAAVDSLDDALEKLDIARHCASAAHDATDHALIVAAMTHMRLAEQSIREALVQLLAG